MYLVYLLPLFLVVLVALAIFAGPILAVILFVLLLIALGAYKFAGPGTDPEHAPPPGKVTTPTDAPEARGTKAAREGETGIWGERRPS